MWLKILISYPLYNPVIAGLIAAGISAIITLVYSKYKSKYPAAFAVIVAVILIILLYIIIPNEESNNTTNKLQEVIKIQKATQDLINRLEGKYLETHKDSPGKEESEVKLPRNNDIHQAVPSTTLSRSNHNDRHENDSKTKPLPPLAKPMPATDQKQAEQPNIVREASSYLFRENTTGQIIQFLVSSRITDDRLRFAIIYFLSEKDCGTNLALTRLTGLLSPNKIIIIDDVQFPKPVAVNAVTCKVRQSVFIRYHLGGQTTDSAGQVSEGFVCLEQQPDIDIARQIAICQAVGDLKIQLGKLISG